MRIIRSLIAAFSMYSRIPMPRIAWQEDTRYDLCFLPLVGAVIGGIVCAFFYIGEAVAIPAFVRVCMVSLIPLVLTGGIHIDGFLDVMDAKSSYRSKEEKLAILKDPHIGAFAVISFAKYALVWLAAVGIIVDRGVRPWLPIAMFFVLSRAGAATSALALPKAKKEGMLYHETERTGRREFGVLIAELAVCMAGIIVFDIWLAVAMTVVFILFFIYFVSMTDREFGGVTGDTAGYFICVSELLELVTIAAYSLIRS